METQTQYRTVSLPQFDKMPMEQVKVLKAAAPILPSMEEILGYRRDNVYLSADQWMRDNLDGLGHSFLPTSLNVSNWPSDSWVIHSTRWRRIRRHSQPNDLVSMPGWFSISKTSNNQRFGGGWGHVGRTVVDVYIDDPEQIPQGDFNPVNYPARLHWSFGRLCLSGKDLDDLVNMGKYLLRIIEPFMFYPLNEDDKEYIYDVPNSGKH